MARFRANTKSLHMAGGNNVIVNELVMEMSWEDLYKIGGNDRVLAIKNANEKFEAMCFLMGAKDTDFGQLKKELERNMYVGRDEYPTTMQDAYELLMNTMSVNNRRVSGNRRTGRGRGGARGNVVRVNFAQRQNANPRERQNGPVMGVNGIMHDQIRCFRCNNLGHYSDNFPSPGG